MQDKKEITPELFSYAFEVANNQHSCREIRKWLEEKQYSVKEFLIALTLAKKGNLDETSYQEIAQEFMIKWQVEIKKNWAMHFQPAPLDSELYKAILLEQNMDGSQLGMS